MSGVFIRSGNRHGSRLLRGPSVAALFYSLLASAKLSGIEASAYIRKATRRAIESPGTVTLTSPLPE